MPPEPKKQKMRARKKQILSTIMFKGESDEVFDSSVAVGSKRSHYGAPSAKAIWELSNGFTLQKWGAQLDEWMFSPLQVFREHQGMHSASPHYQGKTQPNQNGDKNRKETRNGCKGGARSRSFSLKNKQWNQIPEWHLRIVMLIASQ